MVLLKLCAGLLIIALFLFSKLYAYEARILPKYKKGFGYIILVIKPILKAFSQFFKPHQVGNGIALDTAQFVLLILLLLIMMA